MEYTTLGDTGMEVSRICLGCMSFGTSDWREWVVDEEAGKELVDRAIELGINFFDTANMYSEGESERILGEALEGRRDEAVVATKLYFQMDDSDPNSGGLSRKAIEQELDNSLDRLGMDTVDLLQIHRWDYDTPIETTLRALDDAVRREKVRYLGASSMWAHQFAEALHTSDRLGFDRFVTMQNHYNLLYREEEREMLPLCEKENVGVIPWSPLARGWVARPHQEARSTERGETDELAHGHPYLEGGGREINERVQQLADEKGVKMAQIGLAWLFHKDWVDAPIVGTTSIEHLEDAVEALDISLSDSDIDYLEEPYEPVRVSGHD
ncbi:oxidoreductase, aryl-alcohol dehydrogenase like protein [Halogeometricum borinquense DSM 11551]|uniref:Oxidoreductase, aryl-alcohol dehydrogenase like protein n=1 Tax=Halogeometricum borinquense (strain ATCC 700274 / DSM 11551 / JCM 10706 / KCTC 4070 / PR3) TaxID=469382 RepID=E4NNU5_HALBP|nr:aldo/keto reductase [Halogeometricum borinquense]ADQ67559.1 predicted oxidoreductase, aryl-alcohol dehydrogenase like protein [Halogeometricum borinquense DSM 11551]ELY23761.1 oxidoreductase, aryl-alcohol dehydrogenase like protein [Halogeometricum borinquense DSM 11551]